MRNLNDILQGMSSLQDAELELSSAPPENDEYENVYFEDVARDIAMCCLGDSYDSKCKYKLITQKEVTTLIKIDPEWPADRQPVYDDAGRIVNGPAVEFVLEAGDDVQDYISMLNAIKNNKLTGIRNSGNTRDIFVPNKKSSFVTIGITFGVTVIILWIAAVFVLYKLQGGM